MKDFESFEHPISAVSKIHHINVHEKIHIPISQELKKLGFFTNKPQLKNNKAIYEIGGNNRGSEILTHQLGIGKSLVPIPQHHHSNEYSVRHLVDRAFSRKPSKYLNYLKILHTLIGDVITNHKIAMVDSRRQSINAMKEMRGTIQSSFSNSTPIGQTIEQKQKQAKHHSDVSYEHEKMIKDLQTHRVEIVKHARALGKIYGIDSSEKEVGNINSNKIVSGVWDEVF